MKLDDLCDAIAALGLPGADAREHPDRGSVIATRSAVADAVLDDEFLLDCMSRELELIEPRLVVALGATAVLALTGKAIPITRSRGPAELLEHRQGYITVHPSYLLRLPDEAAKAQAYEAFVADLTAVRELGRGAAVPERLAL